MPTPSDTEKVRYESTMFLNGNVITMDEALPRAEAFVVKNGRFICVGTNREARSTARSLAPARTEPVDLKGATVTPGLTDCHVHLMDLGASLLLLDLSTVSSAQELLETVAGQAAKARKSEWILGSGWNETRWKEEKVPGLELLDAAAHSNPVFLSRVDGHAAVVNSLALKTAGIAKDSPDPPGGRILRDSATHEPTGILVDKACEMVREHIPEPTTERKLEMLEAALNELARSGLTAVHDAWTAPDVLKLLLELDNSGKLPVRIHAMLPGSEDLLKDTLPIESFSPVSGRWVCARTIKLFADGALGSSGALLAEPYSDDEKNRGTPVLTREQMLLMVKSILKLGLQPSIHAIGDLANRTVLDVYEECLVHEPSRLLRPRIEHAQLLLPSDVPRFASLGITVSVQPVHLMSDMAWLEERLGPGRIRNAFLWQSLLRSGAKLVSGSDCPTESPNPLLGIYAAVTRKNPDGEPRDGWFSEECMTREQALRTYTLDAAYASFQENVRGSITEGKLADFTVLDRDVLSVPAEELPATRVLTTFVEGHEIVGCFTR